MPKTTPQFIKNTFHKSYPFFLTVLLMIIMPIALLKSVYIATSGMYKNKDVFATDYSEGLIGQVDSINPLFLNSSASRDVASLVFSSLLKKDGENNLKPDLAQSWEVSSDQKNYTFKLRPDIYWHDGVKLSADDIVFTIDLIKNPDINNPLRTTWNNIKVFKVDEYTIRFTLPISYNGFLDNCDFLIMPKHRLESIDPSHLSQDKFGTSPIGTGPYKLASLEPDLNIVKLKLNDKYYQKIMETSIENVTFRTYSLDSLAADGYIKGEIDGIYPGDDPEQYNDLIKSGLIKDNIINSSTIISLHFNMNKVFKSLQARQIASKAIDTNIIYNDLHTKYGLGSINSILTPEHLGYQDKLNTEFDSKFVSSNKELIKSAFTQPISIVTLDRYYLKDMSTSISGQLNRAGIDNNVVIASDEDLQNKYIRPKNYDILLFGQNIGGDSDLYSFLHSSQAGQEGLNLSNYKSTEMDRLLEQVRGSKDIDAKIDKVTKVLLLWQKDIPAKVVARKQYQYFQSVKIEGGVYKYMSAPYQRFADILSWKISK